MVELVEDFHDRKSASRSMALGVRELLIVSGCLSVWVAILRVPFLIPSVVDWDESLYLLIAEGWRHGQVPYAGLWDNKPVGIFAIFALALAAFGDSLAAIRIAGSLTILATAFVLFLIGRREFGSRSAGLLAAFLYPAFTVGLGAGVSNAEIFFAAFTTLGIYLGCGILRALQAGESIGFLRPFLTGLSFGAAFQVKFLTAGEMLFVFVFLSAVLLLSRPRDPARAFRFVVAFGIGCTVCTAMSFAYFAAHGALDALIFANFIAPRLYVVSPFGVNNPAASLLRLGRHLSYFSSMIVIVLAVMPVMLRSQAWRAQGRTLQALLILGWSGGTLVGAASTGKFFVHYFIPLAAPLAILCALAVEYVWRRRHAASPGLAGIAALVGIIAAPPLLFYLFVTIPSLRGLGINDVPRQIADDLRRSAPEHAVLYVVDYHPIIYFLADAPPPTRFPFPPHLISDINSTIGVDPAREVEAIFRRRPDFIVVTRTFLSETEKPINQMVARFVNENYELTKIFSDGDWGNILLYRRR